MRHVFLLLLLFLFCGCGEPSSRAERDRATAERERAVQREQLSQLSERVNQAEEAWRKAGYDSYELEVRYEEMDSIWVSLTVRKGQIVERSCRDETRPAFPSCERFEADPLAFTVPGLFRMVREEIGDAKNWSLPADSILRFELDLRHHYPRRLRWLQPEPFEWEVTSFTPLE